MSSLVEEDLVALVRDLRSARHAEQPPPSQLLPSPARPASHGEGMVAAGRHVANALGAGLPPATPAGLQDAAAVLRSTASPASPPLAPSPPLGSRGSREQHGRLGAPGRLLPGDRLAGSLAHAAPAAHAAQPSAAAPLCARRVARRVRGQSADSGALGRARQGGDRHHRTRPWPRQQYRRHALVSRWPRLGDSRQTVGFEERPCDNRAWQRGATAVPHRDALRSRHPRGEPRALE